MFTSAAAVPAEFAGFELFDKDIYIRHPTTTDPLLAHHPRYVLLFGWGDAQPKHLAKYIDGYVSLFPATAIVVFPSAIMPLYFTTIKQRARFVSSIIPIVYPAGPATPGADRVIAQVMSNGGCTYYSGLQYAFAEKFGAPMPHRLLALDSTPGSTGHTPWNIYVWSAATALALRKRIRLPFPVTFALCVVILLANAVVTVARGEKFFGTFAKDALLGERYSSKDTRRLFLYGQGDSVIYFKQIEENIARIREGGWDVDVEVFEGTEHVSHMRGHGEQYWKAIASSWQRAADARQT